MYTEPVRSDTCILQPNAIGSLTALCPITKPSMMVVQGAEASFHFPASMPRIAWNNLLYIAAPA